MAKEEKKSGGSPAILKLVPNKQAGPSRGMKRRAASDKGARSRGRR